MKQEDKQLLIQALSTLLPYEVMLDTPMGNKPLLALVSSQKYKTIIEYDDYRGFENDITEWEGGDVELIKPYLRPLSSMTEEEILELYKIAYDTWYCDSLYYKTDEFIDFKDSIQNNSLCFKSSIWLGYLNKVYKWLNVNHFDYWGLIDRGLAIAVTAENNPYVSKEELE